MSTYTDSASLNFYRSSGSWQNEGTASQGIYDSVTRTGVFSFSNMNLANKIIKSITLTIVSESSGGSWSKTANIYHSNYQGEIDTSKTGTQYKGSSIGNLSGAFYSNTLVLDATDLLSASLSNGENAFVLYSADTSHYSSWNFSYNYFKWATVTINVEYDEGLIYIDNGASFDAYEVYIDNGSSWDRYIQYVDNGSTWDICG